MTRKFDPAVRLAEVANVHPDVVRIWLHDAGVRLVWEPKGELGRDMTADEQIRLGVTVPYDDVPD